MYRDHQQAAMLRAGLADERGLSADIDRRLWWVRRVNAMVWARWGAGCAAAAGALALFFCALVPKVVSDIELVVLLVGVAMAPIFAALVGWAAGLRVEPPRLGAVDPLTDLCRREARSEAAHACRAVGARVERSHRALLAGYITVAPLALHFALWLALFAVFTPSVHNLWVEATGFGSYVRIAAQGTILGHVVAAILAWRAPQRMRALRTPATLAIFHALVVAAVAALNSIIVIALYQGNVPAAALVMGAGISGVATLVTGFFALWVGYLVSKAWANAEQRALDAAAAPPPAPSTPTQ